MSVRKPIWCTCRKTSWTRRQLLAAWENGQTVICPEPSCARQITPEAVQELLERIKALRLGKVEDFTPVIEPEQESGDQS